MRSVSSLMYGCGISFFGVVLFPGGGTMSPSQRTLSWRAQGRGPRTRRTAPSTRTPLPAPRIPLTGCTLTRQPLYPRPGCRHHHLPLPLHPLLWTSHQASRWRLLMSLLAPCSKSMRFWRCVGGGIIGGVGGSCVVSLRVNVCERRQPTCGLVG